jgi:hypothetical protein
MSAAMTGFPVVAAVPHDPTPYPTAMPSMGAL